MQVSTESDKNLDFMLANCGIFENGVLLMYKLEGVNSIVNFITAAYEEYQSRLPFSNL